jgi:hypothetical protein
MKRRASNLELETAACGISSESLQTAIVAIEISCKDYLRLADLFSQRLDVIEPHQIHKFARALTLTILGHLPTRPGTCPFCIQFGKDRSCKGCGYALTHGRCDSDDSSFSLFIEAFQELGRVVYQDTGEMKWNSNDAKMRLKNCIQSSCDLARQLQEDLPKATALQLMQQKKEYLDGMLCHLPVDLLSEEVKEQCCLVQKALEDYW